MIVTSQMTNRFTFVLLLTLSVLQTNVLANQKEPIYTIRIDRDLTAWDIRGPAFMSRWEAGTAKINPIKPKTLLATAHHNQEMELVNTAKGGLDIFTREEFGDCIIELDVMVAEKANSGIYVMGRYEVQVKDSFGKVTNLEDGDMGGIVGTSPPRINPCAKPGEWQHFVIEFRAPHFENKKRIAPAQFITVTLNEKVIQKNIKMGKGPTSGTLEKNEVSKGPLMLQPLPTETFASAP